MAEAPEQQLQGNGSLSFVHPKCWPQSILFQGLAQHTNVLFISVQDVPKVEMTGRITPVVSLLSKLPVHKQGAAEVCQLCASPIFLFG